MLGALSLAQAQSPASAREQGFGLLSGASYSSDFPFELRPGFLYQQGKSQYELSISFNPFFRDLRRSAGGCFGYKYYPNFRPHKFSLYFLGEISYLNLKINSYYPTQKQYLRTHLGYGFEIRAFDELYLSANTSLGLFSYQKNSEIPAEAFQNQDLFEEMDYSLQMQFCIGYRF